MEKLFQTPQEDILSSTCHYVDYRSTSQLNSGGPVEFFIPAAQGELIDLQKTRLFLKLQITKGDGTSLENVEKVGPINLLLHSMFQQVELFLQQQKSSRW